MNQYLKIIEDLLQRNEKLSDADKEALIKSIIDADKQWSITDFKLDRTEKVKKTTAILLEETIEELEQKRKAIEAQSRELEIEKALEKVRSSALDMKEPSDMLEVCRIISEQLELLTVKEIRNVQTAIFYEGRGTYMNYEYYAKHKKTFITETIYTNHEVAKAFAAKMLEGKGEIYITNIQGEEKVKEWIAYQKTTNVFIDTFLETATSLNYYWFSLGPVALGISTYVPLNDNEFGLFKRFLNVFELAYRRYLDIEKAEAQTKESQVQLAMERVRARTMAMQQSSELPDAANILFQQVQSLGMPAWSAGYCIWDEDKKSITLWMSSAGIVQKPFRAPVDEDPSFIHFYEALHRGETFYVEEIGGDELVSHYKYMCQLPVVGDMLNKFVDEGGSLPVFQIYHLVFFSQGFLLFITYEPVPESHEIFKRFGKVFEQTYTRFLDLQKAEAQAREAQIEAALERVRSEAMAMQKSEDLANVVAIVFEELDKLDLGTIRCGIAILDKEKRSADLWTAAISDSGTIAHVSGDESMDIHPLLQGAFDAWLELKDYSYLLKGEDLINFYKALSFANYKLPDSQFIENSAGELQQHLYVAHFPAGGLYAFRETTITEEAKTVIRRFADVFNLTYTRFNDLRQAEAQAKEAKIELGLERVRARAMAMRNSDELNELVSTLFNELTRLDLILKRCIIWIFDETTLASRVWMSNSEDKNAADSYHIPKLNHPYYESIIQGWKERKLKWVYDLQGDDKRTIDELLLSETELFLLPEAVKKGILSSAHTVVSGSFGNFGLIEASGPVAQSDEQLDILSRFGKVFDLTYTRFNDLKIAEAHAVQAEEDLIKLQTEKKRAEDALKELRETQKQLIQSEKMASLGELTAGIAHEIQNPLNFVNNFSDVSNELIAEMVEEVEKGNYEEAKSIAEDVKQNLEKINYHGKRADAIVKGMLQHSQSSSGQKELTEINLLADEYLRLAYHGLRAKDKSFNTKFETDFDISIGKLNIVPQDIGRVILNLINNAFYTVTEKKKQDIAGYEPTVTITTKKFTDKVELRVIDNGNGIPQKLLDKIFHPFFTTKPAGQGTGLGLSLSYDIIKAYGGEIKVETQEGKGTTFIIQL